MAERFAREDKRVDLISPTENIDAPRANRYLPEEFSGQIQEIERRKSYLAEIPKSAAAIALNVNEYHSSLESGELANDLYRKELEQHYERKEMEDEFQLISDNMVYDQGRKLNQELIDAENDAINNNRSVLEATTEVLERNAQPEEFENNPYAQERWSKMFASTSLESEAKAKRTDISTQQAWMFYNMDDALKVSHQSVAVAGEDIDTAFKSYMSNIQSYMGKINPLKAKEVIDKGYDALVAAKADYLVKMAQEGNITLEEAKEGIQALSTDYAHRTYNWLDSNGKQVYQEDGTPAILDVKLGIEMQDALGKSINDLRAKASAADYMGSADFLKAFNDDIGWDDIEKRGFSMFTRASDSNAAVNKVLSALDAVQRGAYKDSVKADMTSEITKKGFIMCISKLFSEAMGASGKNSVEAQKVVQKLYSDLAGGYQGDWANYSIPVTTNHGVMRVAAPAGLQTYINNSATAKLFWSSALPVLQSLVGAGASREDFLESTNSTFGIAQTNILNVAGGMASTGGSFLISGINPEERTINPAAVRELTSAIGRAERVASSFGESGVAITSTTVNGLLTLLDDPSLFRTASDKWMGARAMAQALTDSGYSGLVLRRMSSEKAALGEAGQNTKVDSARNMLLAACYLTTGASSGANNIIKEAYAKGLGDEMVTRVADQSQNEIGGVKNVNNIIKGVISKYNVPNSYYPSLIYLGRTIAYAASLGDPKQADTALKSYMNSVVGSNFYSFSPSSGMSHSIYRGNPALKNADLKYLDRTMSNTLSTARELLTGMGMNTEARALNFAFDENSGKFNMRSGGKTVTVSAGGANIPLGSIFTDYANRQSGIQPQQLADYTVASFLMNTAATNPTFRTKMVTYRPSVISKITDPSAIQSSLASKGVPMVSPSAMLVGLTKLPIKDKDRTPSKTDIITSNQLQKEAMQYAYILSDPAFVKKYMQYRSTQNKAGMAGKIMDMKPASNITPAIRKSINSQSPWVKDRILKILQYAEPARSHAGKVSSADVSIPIAMASVGEESYIDLLNVADIAGYNITGVELPGVVASMDNPMDELEGVMTGAAASITEGDLTGAAANISYTKDQLKQKVEYYARKHNIPVGLALATAGWESGYNPKATSKAGAAGIMQLMPATAKGLGVTDIYDVDQNIEGGMKYLGLQYKRFGDWGMALAAYNAGPGAVRKYGGIPPYPETQRYVKGIMSKWSGGTGTYPITMSISGNRQKFIDPDTNMLSVKGMDNFIKMINETGTYKNNVKSIATNRPELLENKPEYADYAYLRRMKGADGGPLFVKGNVDGFQLNMKRANAALALSPAAKQAITDDMVNSQSKILTDVGRPTAAGLLDAFGNRYKNSYNSKGAEDVRFGLANLTPAEYVDYGVPLSALHNPVMQARVLTQEYQRAEDVLGSARKAVFALAGGNMVDSQGRIRSWEEIKRDKEAYREKWFIKPAADAAQRNQINSIISRFNRVSQTVMEA